MRLRERLTIYRRSLIETWKQFSQTRMGVIGLGIISFFTVLAVFGPYIAPYDPMKVSSWDVAPRLSMPYWVTYLDPTVPRDHVYGLLGTDELGRDLLSALIHGTSVSMLVGFLAGVFAITLGLFMGIFAGFLGGFIDELLMRTTDLFLILPGIPLAVILVAIFGSNIWNIIAVVGVISWPRIARIIRSQTLTLKERAYVEASRVAGAGNLHILSRHILPNVTPLLLANLTIAVAFAVFMEAAMSFLGLGDTSRMSWGMILWFAQTSGALYLLAWWYFIPPGLCISIVVSGFFFVGRALDEIVNPRLRRR